MLYYLIASVVISHVAARDRPIHDALSFGQQGENVTRENCIWRKGHDRDQCPDPNIFYYLYTPSSEGVREGGGGLPSAERVVWGAPGWLRASRYDPALESVVLVHGYGGVSDRLPMGVLKNAYLQYGRHNVFVVDWGELAPLPCYPAAVHNLRPVARCLAQFLAFLRDSGVPVARTTCVGHSLGAHVCGVAANYLLFRMHRIIGLDPARPLIKAQKRNHLDETDALVVQVLHTSSTFGDTRRHGTVDVCVNGGRVQPFCANTTNEQICSHIRSVCYMAESIDPATARKAFPCSSRRCHGADRIQDWKQHAPPVSIGQNTPDSASGTYCVANDDAPFCPRHRGDPGDPQCCVPPSLTPQWDDGEGQAAIEAGAQTIAPTTTAEPVASDVVRTYTINPTATRLPNWRATLRV